MASSFMAHLVLRGVLAFPEGRRCFGFELELEMQLKNKRIWLFVLVFLVVEVFQGVPLKGLQVP